MSTARRVLSYVLSGVLVVAPLTLLAPAAHADPPPSGPGSLDPSFGSGGTATGPSGVAVAYDSTVVRRDGRVVAAFTLPGSGTVVDRFLPDGTVDTSFGSGGSVTLALSTPADTPKGGLAEDGDGRLYVASASTDPGDPDHPYITVVRLTPKGAPDPTFGTGGTARVRIGGGHANDHATGVVVDPRTGTVFVSAWAGLSDPGNDFAVVALTPEGVADTGFGPGGVRLADLGEASSNSTDTARGIALAPGGDLVVVGFAKGAGNQDDVGVWKVRQDGSDETDFSGDGKLRLDVGSGAPDGATSVVVASDGSVFVGVHDESGGQRGAVLKLTSTGTPDASFGTAGGSHTGVQRLDYGVGGDTAALALDARGRVVVGGGAGAPTVSRLVDARYPYDTTFDGDGRETLSGCSGGAAAVAVQPDDKLLAVGVCSGTATVWRLDGTDRVAVPSTTASGGDGVASAILSTSNVSLGEGVGSSVTVAPGAPVSLSFDWAIGAANPDNDPIDQVVYGFINPGPTQCVDVGAVEHSGGASGHAASAALTAPAKPGVYYLAAAKQQYYGCATGTTDPLAIGWTDAGSPWPSDAAPGPSQYLAEVTVEGVSAAGLTASQQHVTFGQHVVPTSAVPLSTLATNLTALAASPLRGSPLRGSPLRGSPLRGSDVTAAPLRGSPLRGSPLRGSPLRGSPLRGSPIPLSTVPLTPPATWATVLAGTIYAGQPLQNVTLQQVALLPSSPALDAVTLADIDLSRTPLRDLSLVAFLLGDTPVSGLGITVPAGIDASQSLLGLELAGVDVSALESQDIHVVGRTLVDAPLTGMRLGDLWLSQVPALGGLQIGGSGVPTDWVDLTRCPTGCTTLAALQAADADHGITDRAQLGLLTTSMGQGLSSLAVADLIPGLVPRDQLGYEDVAPSALSSSAPAPDHGVRFTTTFHLDCGNAGDLSVKLAPPAGFRVLPSTAVFQLPGAGVKAGALAVSTPAGGGVQLDEHLSACTGTHVGTASVEAEAPLALGRNAVDATTSVSFNSALGGTSSAASDPFRTTTLDSSDEALTADAGTDATSTLFLGYVSSSGERDSYTLPAPRAGSDVTVTLSHVPSGRDYDLSFFGPALPALRDAPLRGSPLRGSPLRGSAVDDTTLDPTTSASSAGGDVQADVPVQPPLNMTTLGVSARRGDASESVTYHVPDSAVGAQLDVVVSGYNGASDAAAPYVLLVSVTPPAGDAPQTCNPAAVPHAGEGTAGAAVSSLPASAETLILTDQRRLGDVYGAAAAATAMSKLSALAARSDVNGVVVPVEGNADVARAYTEWDQHPCSVSAANAVVTAIDGYVDALRATSSPRLKYLVIAGGDQIVPLARVQDRMDLDNEKSYANDEVYQGAETTLSAALRGGYVLTDDPYGDFNPIPWLDGQAYVPDVALGRLVETAADISSAVDAFVASNGVRTPNASYTAGYDFNADGAQRVADVLTPRVPTGSASTSINGTWTKTDAVAGLTRAAHGYGSVNAHYDAYRALPANEFSAGTQSQLLTTADLPGNLSGSVLFTIGCHAGLSVADTFVASATEAGRKADWSQTIAARGGLYAANTGYGYGDDTAVAYSEKLMADFATNLDGSMTVGQALMFAKQSGVHLPLSVVDVKVMEEATFYGLPMYRLGAAGTSAGSVVPTIPADPGSATTASGDPVTVSLTDQTHRHLVRKDGTRGSYFVVQDGTAAAQPPLAIPGRPIEPQTSDTLDLRADGKRAHGVVLEGLSTHLTTSDGSFDPVYSTAVPDSASSSPEPGTVGSYFPSGFASVVEKATPAGIKESVVLAPGQFRAASSTSGLGFQQLADSMTYRVLYSDSTDVTPPEIGTVDGSVSGGSVSFVLTTPAVDAVSASVLYLVHGSTGATAWKRLALTASADGHTFTGSSSDVDGSSTVEQFFVQLVDSANNVSVSSKKGQDFQAAPGQRPGAPVITVDGTPVGGHYVGPQQVSIVGATTYTLDGGAAVPYTGSFVVSGRGEHTVHAAGAGDTSSDLTFVLDDTPPPTITITSPSAGTAYVAGAAIPPVFSCDGYGTVTCSSTPATPDSTVGTHTFTVSAADSAGHTASESVTYTVGRSPFVGFLQPVNDPPGSGPSVFKAGSTIPMKFQVVDSDGRPVADALAATYASSCFAKLTVARVGTSVGAVDEAVYTDVGDSGSCFRYDATSDTFVYNFSTKGFASGTYSLRVTFPGGFAPDHSVTVGLR